MRKNLLSVCCISIFGLSAGQVKDSLRTENIESVVITGQYNPQSIQKSLYKVEVISSEDIKRMSANSVAEVLNQNLNILIIPEKNSGDSKANFMGLGANYTKVLVDNIPVIGDTSIGNNIDLTKLSLENVERIEIVKGSMGVEFGNNALAGVINIITKKSINKKWNIRGFVQEETVGKEYDWVDVGKGRHIQSLGVSHNISDKWFATLDITRNDFQGFRGTHFGRLHFEQDGKRGYLWMPKENINPSLLVRFSGDKTKVFYKADYLNETMNYYSPTVEQKMLGGGNRTFIARDKDYFTSRMLHHLNLRSTVFNEARLSADFSYQKQKRQSQDYFYNVPARQVEEKDPKLTYYEAETFYSRSSLSDFIKSDKINVQVAYELDYTTGFASWKTGRYDGNDQKKEVLNGGVFASAEFHLSDQWFLRPGFRVNFSDGYKTKPNFSLVLKNKINEQSEFRAIVGTANRNPTFEELFAYFVDANHDIRGNENLKPEDSYSGTLYYSIYNKPGAKIKWGIDLSSMYLQMQNRIDMAIVSQVPLQYQYINLDTFQSWVNVLSAKVSNRNFGVNGGVSLLGRSFHLFNLTGLPSNELDDSYKYSVEVNGSVYYNLLKTNTTFALYYKGFGKSYNIAEDKSLGITQHFVGERDGFTLLDFSISQKFFKNHFTLSLGVRNIFDVTDVDNDLITQGPHGERADRNLLYGRSYFTKLNFNF